MGIWMKFINYKARSLGANWEWGLLQRTMRYRLLIYRVQIIAMGKGRQLEPKKCTCFYVVCIRYLEAKFYLLPTEMSQALYRSTVS